MFRLTFLMLMTLISCGQETTEETTPKTKRQRELLPCPDQFPEENVPEPFYFNSEEESRAPRR